jgi:hypothetical protein
MRSRALSPSQQKTYTQAAKDIADTSVVAVWGASGLGRTTITKALQAKTGGAVLSIRDYVERMAAVHPLGFEETFQKFVLSAFKKNRTVHVDDLHLLNSVVCCAFSYPRKDGRLRRSLHPSTARSDHAWYPQATKRSRNEPFRRVAAGEPAPAWPGARVEDRHRPPRDRARQTRDDVPPRARLRGTLRADSAAPGP